MRKISTLAFLISSSILFSQNPPDTTKYWKTSGFVGLNYSQTALNNWQGGGQNNLSINSILNFQLEYKKNKNIWTNKLDAQYGLNRPGDDKLLKKNLDQLLFISKFNTQMPFKHFYYSTMVDFRTQFAPGYTYKNDSIVGRATSDFFSPAYLQLAIGIDYKPADYFGITLSPLSGKSTFVLRQYLADAGAFGVEKAKIDPSSGNIIQHGKKFRLEYGARLTIRFKKDLNKMISWDSYLDIFSNYFHNPQNMDILFNNLVTIKLNKIFTVSIISQLLYDDDVTIIYDWNKDGKFDNPKDIYGPRLQMLHTLGIGIGYKF